MAQPDWLNKASVETAIDLWHRLKGRPMARRAGYLILAAVALEANVPQMLVQGGFKLLGVNVPTPDTPHWVSLGFAALAVILLFGDRYLAEAPHAAPNPHDIELFTMFRQLFDDDAVRFFRSWDFAGGSFEGKYFNVLSRIGATWVGAKYQFDDPEMAKIWNDLFPKSRKLASLIAQYTVPADRNPEWCQPFWYAEDFHSDATMEKTKKLNDAAEELVDAIDRLEAAARSKQISTPKTGRL
ncbi:MAG: hypothetical protein QOF14_2078 [Hyphomicrobiales bacterium]|jgi:hypothetical protein|nr:hypothetical protein [Hyphomicrobiales bacterium]